MNTLFKDARLSAFLAYKHFTQLSQIQDRVFPVALKGRDIIAISKTGTGKTHAYLMPIFAQIDPTLNETQAVIVSPTQELTQQIYQFAQEMLPFFEGVRVQKAVKGQDKNRLVRSDAKHPHLLIGTLGKLTSLFLDEGIFRLDQARTLVIDEADMMLDPDNLIELDKLAGRMRKQLQILVFSATIPDNMNAFMRSYMHQPELIRIAADEVFDPRIEHVLIPVKEDAEKKLFQLMPVINPALCLIFVRDAKQLERLVTQFIEKGIRHVSLHGKMTARERSQTLKQIQDEQIVYVLSTDVAARGLDFPGASDIISLGFPKDLSFYTHRAGRTGRAGKSGRIFALYSEKDDANIRKLIDTGIHFKHFNLNQNGLRELKPYNYTHQHRKTELDLEISKMVQGRSKTVKPGYKKKLTAQIEELKRKRKRKIIQDSIKAQHKLKSKLKQIEKKTGE